MDVKTMVVMARRLFGEYDLHARSGYPPSVPLPNQEAARQIVDDAIAEGLFLQFVSFLIQVDREGFVGRRYRIPRIRDILLEVLEAGYHFEEETGTFVEDAQQRRTKNWGVLREEDYYLFSFLRFDVAGNSRLVRNHDEPAVEEAYGELRQVVQRTVEKRNGRLWSWEGDGGLAAFYTDDIHGAAVHSAMELLHELFLYNVLSNGLHEPLRLRIAVHAGTAQYVPDFTEMNSDVIKRVMEIESGYTEANSVSVSDLAFRSLDSLVRNWFTAVPGPAETTVYRYRLEFEPQ
jgi:hypothetical protein